MSWTQRICLTFAVFYFSFMYKVSGNGSMQVKLSSFDNPGGKGDNGHCCDGKWMLCESGGGCDHYFRLCFDSYGSRANDMSTCPYGTTLTGTVHNKANIVFGASIGSTPNPITYTFTRWQTGVRIKVDIWDDDGGSSHDKVDFLSSDLALSASKSVSEARWTNFTIRARTALLIQVRAYCSENWYGSECDVLCHSANGPNASYTCDESGRKICSDGWTGDDCDQNIDDCANSPCMYQGTCKDGISHYTCLCNPGFTGINCEININECLGVDCNGGSCLDKIGRYSCLCQPGFTGVNCETDIDDCAGVDCHWGTCIDGHNQYTCHCQPGYTGTTCNQPEGCLTNPCLNNGICQDTEEGANCRCVSGWTGHRCELDVDECSNNVCSNVLHCENTDGGFTCTCQPGWTGQLCQVDTDECLSQPCANGGTCLDMVNGYKCRCTELWMGMNCLSNRIMEGGSIPRQETSTCQDQHERCQNNGSCIEMTVDTEVIFKCHCTSGWTGEWCESPSFSVYSSSSCFSSSSSHQCLNGGICVPLEDESEFHCQCPEGFTGEKCEIENEYDYDKKHQEENEREEFSSLKFQGRLEDNDASVLSAFVVNLTTSDEHLLPLIHLIPDIDILTEDDIKVDHIVLLCETKRGETESVFLFRLKIKGTSMPRSDVDRILRNVSAEDFIFLLPQQSFISTDRECAGSVKAAHLLTPDPGDHIWYVVVGVVVFVVISGLILIAVVTAKRRNRKPKITVSNPIYMSGIEEEDVEVPEEGCSGTYTFNCDTQRTGCNLYMNPLPCQNGATLQDFATSSSHY